ncbi:MAG: porin [Phycisphaerales bacterium JB043]
MSFYKPRITIFMGLLLGAPCAIGETSERERSTTRTSSLLLDGDMRKGLLRDGDSGGHDGGFFISSSDGSFRLEIGAQVQLRWILSTGDESTNASYSASPGQGIQDDFQHGFENRRTKLTFSGDAFGDEHAKTYYKVTTSFSRSLGVASLSDAYFGVDLGPGGRLQAGQFKVPLHREWLMSSKRTQAVDRSVAGSFFNAGRSQGLLYESRTGQSSRYSLAVTDGINQSNTSFSDAQNIAFMLGDSDLALTARVETLLAGSWGVFDDTTSAPGQDRALLVGFAAHHQLADKPQDGDLTSYTADVSIEGDGWNAFASIMAQAVDSSLAIESNDMGFVVQAGYYLSEALEGFVRYDLLVVDDNRTPTAPGGNETLSTITLGVNRYLHGHASKLTVDTSLALDEGVSHLDDGLGGNLIYSSPGLGYLGDDDEGEFYVRVQFQLLF